MRLPQTRTHTHRMRHGRRLFTLALVAVVAASIGAGGFLLARSRSPLLPVAETSRSADAIELWRDGEYDRVASVTGEHLHRYPLDTTSLALRGFAQFYRAMETVESEEKQELLVESVQLLRRVLLLPPTSMEPQIRYVLGKAYYHRGEFFYDSAVRELDAARRLGIEQLDLLEYLALTHHALGDQSQAVQFFEEAIDFGDEDVHRIHLADILILEEEYSRANQVLSEVLEHTNDVVLQQHSLLSSGRAYRESGDFQLSIGRFEELLELNPSSAEARYEMGETFLAMEQNDRARFEWREALRLNPNHIESFQRLQEY